MILLCYFQKEKYKELKRQNKGLTNNPNPGYSIFSETEYYFENGNVHVAVDSETTCLCPDFFYKHAKPML